jgi:hypothetical protein
MSDYTSDLEAANEKLQEQLTKAQTLLLSYTAVEFIFLPSMNKAGKLVGLDMRLSFKKSPESILIANLSAEVDEKNVWFLRMSNGEMFKVEIVSSLTTVEDYAKWMMKALAINELPFIIKE